MSVDPFSKLKENEEAWQLSLTTCIRSWHVLNVNKIDYVD